MIHGNDLPPRVREVLDFALGGRILRRGARELPGGVITLGDLGPATEAAFRQEMEDESILSWADIRGLEMSKVWEPLYALPDSAEAQARFTALTEEVADSISKSLPARFRDIADEIGADFRACIINRATEETPSGFYETLLDVYFAGCWPCGWEGPYPEGSLIVYNPHGGILP